MDLAVDLIRNVTDDTVHVTDLNDKTLLGGGARGGTS
jgi:hypothetical protein